MTCGNIYAQYRESASGEIKKKVLTFIHIDGRCLYRFRTCRNIGHLIRVLFFHSKGLVAIADYRKNRNPRIYVRINRIFNRQSAV